MKAPLYLTDTSLAMAVADHLKNLESNPDFEGLMKLYLVDNAARLTSLKAASLKADQEKINSQLIGIAELQKFFHDMTTLAHCLLYTLTLPTICSV